MKKFKKIIIATVAILVVSLALIAFSLIGSKSVRAFSNPAAVPLLTAGNFAILANTGITNVHTSTIIGNIGNSAGAASQMNDVWCSEISGTIYGVDATYTGQGAGFTACFAGAPADKTLVDNAKIDLTAAYINAAGRSVDATVAPELGGTTKTAGVYASTDTTFQITAGAGPLVLDGLGDSSAVFIFKMGFAGTGLTVGPGSIVSLINGAQAKNVFWQVDTATINTTAVFKGNILALNSITVANGANVQGRLLARNGTVTLIADIISIPTALHLRKIVTNDNGGTALNTAWALSAIGATSSPTNLVASTTPVDSGSTFKADTYTLSESGPSGYSSTYSCVNNGATTTSNTITLAAGDDATCTITNNDIAPALHLRKIVTNDNGGTALNTAWTLTANGATSSPTSLASTTPVDSGSTFKADTYTLSESGGPSGYDSSTYSCVKNGAPAVVSNTIILAAGDDATCTITNTYIAPAPSGGGGSSPVVQRILPVISITKIPSPLMLPNGPGLITYAYTVLNPGTVAMRDIKVTDDKCSNVTFVSGDSNNNSWLDTNETWKFTCASQITQTTKNIATVVGYDAGGMSATDVTNATVVVGQPVINYTPVIIATSSPVATPTPIIPKLPNTGLSEINSSWYIIAIISVLSSLSLLYVIGKKHSD